MTFEDQCNKRYVLARSQVWYGKVCIKQCWHKLWSLTTGQLSSVQRLVRIFSICEHFLRPQRVARLKWFDAVLSPVVKNLKKSTSALEGHNFGSNLLVRLTCEDPDRAAWARRPILGLASRSALHTNTLPLINIHQQHHHQQQQQHHHQQHPQKL